LKRSLGVVLSLLLILSCGGEETEPAEPSASAESGCALERGGPLPEGLSGAYSLEEVATYENGQKVETEEPTEAKTIRLTLSPQDTVTRLSVQSSWTTDATTEAEGRVTLEGSDQLAVTVDSSSIPFVFAGATYCLRLEEGANSLTVILELSSEKSLRYRFATKI